MSGKAYTMKEMKAIVEYLTEHRAYSEIKGRKMWMDLAASKITNRTWQSLKETFIKRILPDIHNPYYNLSVQQIASFRQGHDIETRLNNRLQIRSTSRESDKDDKTKDTEKPGTSNGKNEDQMAGEELKQSNLRASTETLVLENCYETAEDVRKALQSPTNEQDKEDNYPPKSLRELITYSEPLTPALQAVIDDFATDEEGDEPKMQIVEPEETSDEPKNNNTEENTMIEISDSEGHDIQEVTDHEATKTSNPLPLPEDQKQTSKTNEPELTNEKPASVHGMCEVNGESSKKDASEVTIENKDRSEGKGNINSNTSCELTQNNLANTVDTLLPGNQEAFEETSKTMPDKQLLAKKSRSNGRKRASSQDNLPKSKKRAVVKKKSISDTETTLFTNDISFKRSNISNENSLQEGPLQVTMNIDYEERVKSPLPENELTKDFEEDSNKNTTETENLCLKSVSLYAEQFSTTKYTDSESDDKNGKKDDKNVKKDDKNEKKDDRNEKTDHNEDYKKKASINRTVDDKSGKVEDKNMRNKNAEKSDKAKKIKASSSVVKTSVKGDEQDPVMVELHSDSISDSSNHPTKRVQDSLVKQHRDRALANVFGFSSGGATRTHRRRTDNRKRTISQSRGRNYGHMSSESSDWTSDTGSEYVSSPPRQHGRKGRHHRKYLKPKSVPILSLEEEGGLFVMYGKKIYPVVKDGKIVKNYVNYTMDDKPDQEESFWKLKYMEEKKKTSELKKLLIESKEQKEETSRVPPAVPSLDVPTISEPPPPPPPQEFSKPLPVEPIPVKQSCQETDPDDKKIKIKFTKNYEEVELEGHWSYVNPVLSHVAKLLQREPETTSNDKMTEFTTKTPPVQISDTSDSNLIVSGTEQLSPKTGSENTAARTEQASTSARSGRTSSVARTEPASTSARSGRALSVARTEQASTSARSGRTSSVARTEQASTSARSGRTSSVARTEQENSPITLSERSTPIEEIVEKVNKRELEIAQEIERHYIDEIKANETAPEQATNVTKRKGRPKKSSTIVPYQSPPKKAKLDDSGHSEANGKDTLSETAQEGDTAEPTNNKVTTRRATRTPQSTITEAASEKVAVRTRRNTPRKSTEDANAKRTTSKVSQDDDARYKFPSPLSANRRSYSNKEKGANQRKNKSATYLIENSSFENSETSSTHLEKIHGDQDTIVKPSGMSLKLRKTSFCVSSRKKIYDTRFRRSYPRFIEDITSESSNSYQNAPLKSMTFQNSTLTSEIYKSESYQLLMNKGSTRTKRIFNLGNINETKDANHNNYENVTKNMTVDSNLKQNELEVDITEDISSNVSMPTSPVLSIVENISINKSLLSNMDMEDFLCDDKGNEIIAKDQIMLNALMTPNEDVSMPLMEQECGIEKSCHKGMEYHYNLNISKPVSTTTKSILGKVNTVNEEDPTLSESLNNKLRELLLESTKKKLKSKDTNVKNTLVDKKVKKARKISSTPRKRKRERKLTVANTDSCIVEEFTESCSHGRQSCPPAITISDHDVTTNKDVTMNTTETTEPLTEKPTRGKRNKTIIKVKILKPKQKSQSDNYIIENEKENNFTDSGINNTESEKLQDFNDSVDLIHNHSETCLNAHECLGDSVQIVENTVNNSLISLGSNSTQSDIIGQHNNLGITPYITQELLSDDAQDGSDLAKEFDCEEPRNLNSAPATVYHTPLELSGNSLLTDDLSEEIPDNPTQNTKWYLFSEDETSNTNFVNSDKKSMTGANLEQIFPIICTIPNLSTITEISRENGDSKKMSDDIEY